MYRRQRRLETLDLSCDFFLPDLVLRYFKRRIRNQIRPPDGDAGRYCEAVEREGHVVLSRFSRRAKNGVSRNKLWRRAASAKAAMNWKPCVARRTIVTSFPGKGAGGKGSLPLSKIIVDQCG